MLAGILTINPWIQFLARGLVGSLFIISAGLKIISPADSASLFNSFLPAQPALVSVLTFILILFELLLGAMLLFAVKLHYATLLSCVFFLVATVVGVLFLDEPVDCGCFGSLIEAKTDEFFLLRNLLFLLISLFVLQSSLKTGHKS